MRSFTLMLAVACGLALVSCTAQRRTSADRVNGRNGSGPGLQETASDEQPDSIRRLESVTWNSVEHQLVWDVSKRERKDDTYQSMGTDHYEINMDNATMTVNGETRRFSHEEAKNVRRLMDLISRYAVESTVWWEDGQGEPLDGAPDQPNGTEPKDSTKFHVQAKTQSIAQLAMVISRQH